MKKLALTALVLLVGTSLFAQTAFTGKASDAKAKITADAAKGVYGVDGTAVKGVFTFDLTPDANTLKALQAAKTITLTAKDLGSGAPDFVFAVVTSDITDAKNYFQLAAKAGKSGSPVAIDFTKLKSADAKAKFDPSKITGIQISAGAPLAKAKSQAVKLEISAITVK